MDAVAGMQEMTGLLAQYGLAFVFLNVFLLQVGVPVPAVPTLLAAGALAVGGGLSLPAIIAVAVTASLAGDLIWYFAGRVYGFRVLRFLCRVSISPDSCVRDTEDRFERWGAASLIAAGSRSLRELLGTLPLRILDEDEWRPYDRAASSLFDVDVPNDLLRLRRRLRHR